ncbi:unnamed protein product, partial [Mycena citricolor]
QLFNLVVHASRCLVSRSLSMVCCSEIRTLHIFVADTYAAEDARQVVTIQKKKKEKMRPDVAATLPSESTGRGIWRGRRGNKIFTNSVSPEDARGGTTR